eukprot:1075170-Rhodomonas_salina.2
MIVCVLGGVLGGRDCSLAAVAQRERVRRSVWKEEQRSSAAFSVRGFQDAKKRREGCARTTLG